MGKRYKYRIDRNLKMKKKKNIFLTEKEETNRIQFNFSWKILLQRYSAFVLFIINKIIDDFLFLFSLHKNQTCEKYVYKSKVVFKKNIWKLYTKDIGDVHSWNYGNDIDEND